MTLSPKLSKLFVLTLFLWQGLTLAVPAVECPEMADLWKRWREMRYSLYPKAETLIEDFAPRDFENVWFQEAFTEPMRRFHSQYASDIRAYRNTLLQAYESPAPTLKQYQDIDIADLLSLWHGLGYDEMLGLQFLHPFEVVEFLQNLLLSRLLRPQELGLFYLRRSQGQTRYSAEQLKPQSWRLWADSYYYMLAIDFDLEHNRVRVHGLWERNL